MRNFTMEMVETLGDEVAKVTGEHAKQLAALNSEIAALHVVRVVPELKET